MPPRPTCRRALAGLLGDGVRVGSAAEARSAELAATFGGGLSAVFAVLAMFAVAAAVAAALTTFCVFGIVAKRQQRSVLLLRGVGATRGQVLRALLVNAGLTGLVAASSGWRCRWGWCSWYGWPSGSGRGRTCRRRPRPGRSSAPASPGRC